MYFLLFGLKFDCSVSDSREYNASKISPRQLLRKKIVDVKIYKKLVHSGMQVKVEDVAYAVNNMVKPQLKLVDLLVDSCKYEYSDREAYDEVIKGAVHTKQKRQLVTALRKGTKVYKTKCIVQM